MLLNRPPCVDCYSFSEPVNVADEATRGAGSFIIMHSALPKNFGNSEEIWNCEVMVPEPG
ncbi:MAG: hypothetical protein CVU71_07840 [Deltaproteobacteria bacterium HGW-Deltaproteobacteria-6]|nr:MAG: hypothetical protein CVU71_07840 [Deltaproteobacteria bacterium HGW-Deltaproteobacteria-6]PKN96680.1 MAG: hypothetical protein CVU43_19475 [Chloroflexi bacterium HGW-Chloroflexi-5]